jgi:ribonuclease BN (tRNA processing enzyme)
MIPHPSAASPRRLSQGGSALRRRLAALLLCLGLLPHPAAAFTRIVLLGTAGGPAFNRTRAQPAHAVQVGAVVYLVDCGGGVGDQYVRAGLPPSLLRHVFVTHFHSDHVADLLTFPVRSWGFIEASGEPLTLHGPKPLKQAVKGGLRQFAFDRDIRERDEGKERFERLLRVHQFKREGIVHRDDLVTVTAARVDHVPIRDAFAYRFDTPDLSVVFSGDTAPSPALVRLAASADFLVHEVLTWTPEEAAAAVGLPLDHPFVQHLLNSHTSYRDVGRIAADAGVGTLVLTHFVPADGPLDPDAVLAEVRKSFAGPVVFGEDLMQLPQ